MHYSTCVSNAKDFIIGALLLFKRKDSIGEGEGSGVSTFCAVYDFAVIAITTLNLLAAK